MTKQEFKEYYKKNKTVVIGVPIIIVIVLVNTFVLAPAREAKRRARLGLTNKKTAAVAKSTTAKSAVAKAPITPPPPIKTPFIPKLDNKITTRFALKSVYPHLPSSRNIFKRKEVKTENIVVAQSEELPEVVERPEISYHGFFKIGKNKVAILKLANELIYSKLGDFLKNTTFRLQSVYSDKIVIEDVSNEQREFEISLADTSSDKKIRGLYGH